MDFTEITPEMLRELMDYDAEKGNLYWRVRPREMFEDPRIWRSWNGRFAGGPALTADNGNGYKFGTVLYQRVYAHRAAWAIYYGAWPSDEIDHIDRDRGNNSIGNLREATRMQNSTNQNMRVNNTTGHRYVGWDMSRSLWVVRFRRYGRTKHVGRFSEIADAISARDAALRAVGG